MKLIDLLVQELPKRGGWPVGTKFMAADKDGSVYSYDNKPEIDSTMESWIDKVGYGYFGYETVTSTEVSDWNTAIITREQYEAALAALKQIEWDGVGLPPVGTECEWLASGDHDWIGVKVLAYHEDEVWLQPLNGAQSFTVGNPDDFRPIRTEAERKRELVLKSLMVTVAGFMTTEDYALAENIYDAIAAGKIPGVKLDEL